MRAEDIEDIGRIFNLITKKTVKIDFRELMEEQSRRNADSACFVAELEGKVVGFMIGHVITFGFDMEKSAWIATMGVDPRYMGGGIGARLANELFDYYKSLGITRIFTAVRWDSTDALSFFKTLGFTRSDFINLSKNVAIPL